MHEINCVGVLSQIVLLILVLVAQVLCQRNNAVPEFNPTVSAVCVGGTTMEVYVVTSQPFQGVVHTLGSRNEPCLVYGNGQFNVTLRVNLIAAPGDWNYCGVQNTWSLDDKSVSVVVRSHRTLEKADDKTYSFSCNKAGFKNSRNELSRTTLRLYDEGRSMTEVVYSRPYLLKIDISNPDDLHSIAIKSCIAFAGSNETKLFDDFGCPLVDFMSSFSYDDSGRSAEANVYSMFRFPDIPRLTIQCYVTVCRGRCSRPDCSIGRRRISSSDIIDENLVASNTFFVVEPGLAVAGLNDCSIYNWSWLIGLCIAFAILFLIMLIVNIFLCSALTCSCTKQEIIEKEPYMIEDYDPYRAGWTTSGSQYGSRYSLNGKPSYLSAGSTLNSTRSVASNNSDHYAIVHTHPGTRYTTKSGPRSTLSNGHYTGNRM